MKRFETLLLFIVAILSLTAAPLCAEVKEYTLDNGLKVLISEDHKVPLATFEIWYKVGSRDEQSGKTGLSHLLEHMMFKGTPKYGSKVFSKIIQRNGGVDNAMTTKDYTMYFQTMASDRIGISIELESDRMTNLIMDPKETVSERSVVMEERRMRYDDDPQNSLFENFVATALMTHPYRRPVIGWMSDIASLTRDELYRHYKKFYAPDNAFIVIVGDVNPEEVMKKIKAAFGDMKRSDLQNVPVTREPEQKGEKRVYLRKEAELPYVLAGYHTPSFPHEDSAALEVLSTILSGGKSARLYRSLIYEKKLALNAGADYSGMYLDPFLFFLWGSPAPGKDIAELEKTLFGEIEAIKNAPPTEREVQKAKNQIEASFIFGQDSLYMQAMKIGMFEILGSWKLMDEYLEGIRKVTPEEVQRVARKYLTEDNRTAGILIPMKSEK
ncbi:MAG: insulinase family protein [Nitrospirae bacterium]|nr:insulinase family protein [Nitrospirota bacterium]MCL5422102.1 insulinase family protein [Nitrospirota bacterium]